jgi:hypothetical protein
MATQSKPSPEAAPGINSFTVIKTNDSAQVQSNPVHHVFKEKDDGRRGSL